MKVIAYKKELLKFNKSRNELKQEFDKKGKLPEPYLNIRGYIIPLNKVYVCTNLNSDINFEKVEWLLK